MSPAKPKAEIESAMPFIVPEYYYPIATAKAFFGNREAWTAVRRLGLRHRIRYIGKRGYISGKSLIEFIEEVGKTRDYSNNSQA
ncbi:MAG: hypothetical protein ACKVH8_08410 [Pirellulales bacterium]